MSCQPRSLLVVSKHVRKQPDQVTRFICSLLILQTGLCLSGRLHLTQGLNNLQFRVRNCFTIYLNHILSPKRLLPPPLQTMLKRWSSSFCFGCVPHIFILDLFQLYYFFVILPCITEQKHVTYKSQPWSHVSLQEQTSILIIISFPFQCLSVTVLFPALLFSRLCIPRSSTIYHVTIF